MPRSAARLQAWRRQTRRYEKETTMMKFASYVARGPRPCDPMKESKRQTARLSRLRHGKAAVAGTRWRLLKLLLRGPTMEVETAVAATRVMLPRRTRKDWSPPLLLLLLPWLLPQRPATAWESGVEWSCASILGHCLPPSCARSPPCLGWRPRRRQSHAGTARRRSDCCCCWYCCCSDAPLPRSDSQRKKAPATAA